MTTIAGPLVLYHADCDDGFGAAYAAWRSLGDSAEYRPVYYGDVIAAPSLAGRTVFILDFSFSPEVVRDMAQHATQITLLDHHKSAAAQWAQTGLIPKVEVMFDMQRSGAQMAWDHFHPQQPRPALIDHIGDRDLWRFALPDTRPVCAGLSLLPVTFAAWNEVADQPAALLERGRVVLEVLQRQIDSAVGKDLRPVSLCGHQGLAANVIANTSEVGHAIAKKSGTFSLTFFIKGDLAICSLRSLPPFDVSVIAAHYGGGGHAQASGFTLPIDQFFAGIWR
jgi:oligoribonuclease NrnB/cAMP/cGMP phosphodiesterase (DHH superfamily)